MVVCGRSRAGRMEKNAIAFASPCLRDGGVSGAVAVTFCEFAGRLTVTTSGDKSSTRNHMFDDATCVDPLSETPSFRIP